MLKLYMHTMIFKRFVITQSTAPVMFEIFAYCHQCRMKVTLHSLKTPGVRQEPDRFAAAKVTIACLGRVGFVTPCHKLDKQPVLAYNASRIVCEHAGICRRCIVLRITRSIVMCTQCVP